MTELSYATTDELLDELKSRAELFFVVLVPKVRKPDEPDTWVLSFGQKEHIFWILENEKFEILHAAWENRKEG